MVKPKKTYSEIPATALDVFRLLPKGTRAEVIQNTLYMSPSPVYEHQQIVGTLYRIIGNHIADTKNGFLIVSPFDVYLEEQASAVQPDILFISNKQKKIIKKDGYAHGAPDLIIEVLSGDQTRDRVLKKELYEKAGVKEYFIIDAKTKKTEAFVLKGKKYILNYTAKKIFQSALLKLEFTF